MNINEIARLAAVSRATVSRYLNNGYVSSEKKAVIRRVIEETGYQPSSQAQTLRTKKTSLIGVILPKINSDTISREVEGISDILTRRGYQLILASTNNNVEEELKYLSLFKERQVDGVVFIATMFTRKHKQMLKDYKVPIVLLGQHLDGYPCIYQDDYKAAFQVTEKLAEKGSKFAYIGVTDKDVAVGAQRRKGFEDALRKKKLEIVPERMKVGSFTMDSGYEMARELFEEDPSIDSLVCATDTMAVGAMTYLKEIGLRFPRMCRLRESVTEFRARSWSRNLLPCIFITKQVGWRQQLCWPTLLRMIPGSARRSRWDVNLWNGNLTDNRIVKSGRSRFFLERDLLLFWGRGLWL